MKKNLFKQFFMGIVAMIAVWMGASGSVMMAAGAISTDANGAGNADGAPAPANTANDGGVASVTSGQQTAPELYETDLEQAILELDPMATAFLSVSADAQSRHINAQEFEFYSIGPRIVKTTTKAAITVYTDRFLLPVADAGFATKGDTIRVVGVHGYDKNGNADVKDLMLIVIDKDQTTGYLACYAKNGNNGGTNFTVPQEDIPVGTTLIRMGKGCSESTMQTARVNSVPQSEKGCVQNFMLQIEQTEFDRLTSKRVDWDFNDIVDWNMRDYKVVKELSYLFSIGGLDRHPSNANENNYTMLGIWWQAGRDIEIGHIATDANGNTIWEAGPNGETAAKATSATALDGVSGTFSGLVEGEYYYATSASTAIPAIAKVEIDGTDLVAFNKAAFLGNGGSQTKYLFAGANIVEAFDNIKGKQYETKDIVTENNLTIQNFKTSFGTIKLVYDKLFDICGMANAAFMLDKSYLRKVDFISLKKTQLKLQESGQRNSHGVVLQEVNAVYLQYADAHARVWLAGRTGTYDYRVSEMYDNTVQKTAQPPKFGSANFRPNAGCGNSVNVSDRQDADWNNRPVKA